MAAAFPHNFPIHLLLTTFLLLIFPHSLYASPLVALIELDQCSCQNAQPFSSSLGALSLSIQDTSAFACAAEAGFAAASLPGIVANPSATSEALRSEVSSLPAFSGAGASAVSILLRPLGFEAGLAARSASLVDIRGSVSATSGALPKLLCGLSISPLSPNQISVYVVSELLGLEVPMLFPFLQSQRQDYIEVTCGLGALGPFACFDGSCQTVDLSGLGFVLGSFSSNETVVAVGSGFSAKQFTLIAEVEIVEIAFYDESTSASPGFPVTTGIPAPRLGEQFAATEDGGLVNLAILGTAANNPLGSEVAKVFQIVSLPPASAGVLADNGVPITTLPYNSSDLTNLRFTPAESFYTSNATCTDEADFIELLQFQVFDSGLEHDCVLNPAPVGFCAEQVNDDPVVDPTAFVVDSTEKVKISFGITDADDVTQNGQPTGTGLAGGSLTFSTTPGVTEGTLFTCNADGSCSDTAIDVTSAVVPIVDKICVCYLRPTILTGGSPGIAGTDDITLSVTDAAATTVGPVAIQIQIRELISTCTVASQCTQETDEAAPVFFDLNATSLLNKDLTFSVTQLPGNGLLLQDNAFVVQGAALTASPLEYRPSAGYYNVNALLQSVDGTGTSICPAAPPCLDSLQFRAATDDGSFKEDTVTFAVKAVNEELPNLAAPSVLSLEQGKAQALTNLNVLPGTDGDMFEQVLNLTFSSGLQFDIDTARAVSRGTGTVGSTVQVVESIPVCAISSTSFCTGFISLRGYPTHLNDAMDGARVLSNADSLSAATVLVSVTDGTASLSRTISISYTAADNTGDIVIAAVGAVGGIIAAFMLAMGFIRWRRSSRTKALMERAALEDKLESMTNGKQAKEAPAPPKPSKKTSKGKEKRKEPVPPSAPRNNGRSHNPTPAPRPARNNHQGRQKRKEPKPPSKPKE